MKINEDYYDNQRKKNFSSRFSGKTKGLRKKEAKGTKEEAAAAADGAVDPVPYVKARNLEARLFILFVRDPLLLLLVYLGPARPGW